MGALQLTLSSTGILFSTVSFVERLGRRGGDSCPAAYVLRDFPFARMVHGSRLKSPCSFGRACIEIIRAMQLLFVRSCEDISLPDVKTGWKFGSAAGAMLTAARATRNCSPRIIFLEYVF